MLKLSPQERKVISAFELDADRDLKPVRAETALRDHTIRYYLQRLIERGVLKRRPFIDIYPLGFVDYAIYFSLSAEKQSLKQRVLNDLVESQSVSWIAKLGGDYQYGVAICARHPSHVNAFLDRLVQKYPNIFFDKALSLRLSLTLFPRKYLHSGKSTRTSMSFGAHQSTIQLDQKDVSILAALEKDSQRSLRDISAKINIPIATLQHRIQGLRTRGVLKGFMYQVDPALFGMQSYRLLIYVKGSASTLRKELFAFSEQHPQLCYYIECLGNWDYELGAEVSQAEHIVDITQQLYQTFGTSINAIKVLPVFGHLKISNFPFQESILP